MQAELKRINLMIRDDQAKILADRGLNVSGLVRDLVDDYLSDHKITLSVSEETRRIYDKVISNTGSTDADLEDYLKESLHKLLKQKIKYMIELEKQEFGK